LLQRRDSEGNQFPNRRSRAINVLVALFFASISLLIAQTISNIKDINDSWILEGLLPYFLLVVLFYSLLVAFAHGARLVALLSSVYLVVVNMIPNIKYVYLYGYSDPLLHYGSIEASIISGHASEVGAYTVQYSATPGMHLFVSELSVVTGLDALLAFKLFLVLSQLTVPLAVYLVMRRLKAPANLAKISIAAVAITAPLTYIYGGMFAIFATYVLFLYFCLLFLTHGITSRSELVVAILLGLTILISHDVTTFFLLGFLVLSWIIVRVRKVFPGTTSTTRTSTVFVVVFAVVALAHFVLTSSLNNLSTLFSLIENAIMNLFHGAQPVALSYYTGFNALSLIDKVKILLVRFGKDFLSILLVLLSPLALSRLHYSDSTLKRFYRVLVTPLILALLGFFLLIFMRPNEGRGLVYVTALCPFFVGPSILYLTNSKGQRFNRTILAVVLFCLICFSVMIIYPCQPLLPTFTTTRGDYYALDMREANTVYDRSSIIFASSHVSNQSIWVDQIQFDQSYALAGPLFQSLLTSNRDSANLILVTRSGSAHAIPSGRDALANDEFMENAPLNHSLLYSNGFSYMLLNTSSSHLP